MPHPIANPGDATGATGVVAGVWGGAGTGMGEGSPRERAGSRPGAAGGTSSERGGSVVRDRRAVWETVSAGGCDRAETYGRAGSPVRTCGFA
jgi:hypothetical protein